VLEERVEIALDDVAKDAAHPRTRRTQPP
jgi:hypothetical protein